MKPRITAIEIEDFKSFGYPSERIELDPLTFVVGSNASGKSNIQSCLEFLKNAVMQDIVFAVNELGGANEVKNKILNKKKNRRYSKIRIVVDADVIVEDAANKKWKIKDFDYEVVFNLKSLTNEVEIVQENLVSRILKDDEEFLFKLNRDKKRFIIHDPVDKPSVKSEAPIRIEDAHRLVLSAGFFSMPCVILRDIIKRWHFFNISPEVSRTPSRDVSNIELQKNGENLSAILHRMEKDKNSNLSSIINSLKGIVPVFEGIQTQPLPLEGKWSFQIIEKYANEAFEPKSVSDGTIRLLVLLVIAYWTTRHATLISIEEPENGLHPHVFSPIANIIRNASMQTQFFISTHNPEFLDCLEPNQILLCDRIDGFTRTQKASSVENIDTFKEQFSLGELWEQGALGGVL